MMIKFQAEANPSKRLSQAVADLAPTNPFHTYGYLQARAQLGAEPWVLCCREDGRLLAGCAAFAGGRLVRRLEVPSSAELPDACWQEMLALFRRQGVREIHLGSFAVTKKHVPHLPGEVRREARQEFHLDLEGVDLLGQMHKQHRYRSHRAEKEGLTVVRACDRESARRHAEAVAASMKRRKNRGETVPTSGADASYWAFMNTGVGEVFQAWRGETLMGSRLVLKAAQGAYTQSSGVTPEGQSSSASHILTYEIAKAMQAESKRLLILGGIRGRNPGLEKFKLGFGARPVEMENVTVFMGSCVRRAAISLLRCVRRWRRRR